MKTVHSDHIFKRRERVFFPAMCQILVVCSWHVHPIVPLQSSLMIMLAPAANTILNVLYHTHRVPFKFDRECARREDGTHRVLLSKVVFMSRNVGCERVRVVRVPLLPPGRTVTTATAEGRRRCSAHAQSQASVAQMLGETPK